MKKETNHRISQVLIQEFYSLEGGIVYWNFRINGGKWYKEKTFYRKLPWVELDWRLIKKRR